MGFYSYRKKLEEKEDHSVNMKVQIFRRTVKDRRRGNSYELLYHLAEGIKASGDEPVIVNEHRSGPTVDRKSVV